MLAGPLTLVIKGESEGPATISIFYQKFPEIPVLAVSGLEPAAVAVAAYEQGAKGFLPKFCSSEEFIQAIKCVSSGHLFISYGIKGLLAKPVVANQPKLSDRQLKILELLSLNSHSSGRTGV
jgi:DNA-binding NarL/FixJ family response regulator